MASIFKRGNIYWIKFYQGGRAYQKSLKTPDKKVAAYYKNQKEIELAERRSPLPSGKKEALDCLNEYQESNIHTKSKNFLSLQAGRIRHFLDYSRIKYLHDIKPRAIEGYIKHRLDSGLSPATANHIITNIQTWLNWAIRQGFILDNPASKVNKYKVAKNPPRFLSEDEISRLLEASRDTPYYPAIITILYTGVRIRELLSLEWQDFDWQRKVLTVKNKDSFTTKSKKFRVIPLSSKLIEALKPYRKKDGHCFFSGTSRAWPLRKSFKTIQKKAELKKAGWHVLRHTFASRLVQNGVSIYKVSKWLGHANVTTTMIYAHLVPAKDDDINRI
ncbi:MAG: site-specific integrase [Candidatus Omnitrophica bacterium]|nr:site-specific integrase [Candidatus Omnitrophota bacterium]